MKNELPTGVFQAIQERLRSGCNRGEGGWSAGSEEEDTLTGDLCGSLRTTWVEILDDENRLWKYRIDYKKFRGRGTGAEEKVFGTDGIVEVQIENVETGTKTGKGLLFQAKKQGATGKKKMMEQAQKMESIAPNGSAIFEYGPKRYIGVDAATYLDNPTVLKREESSSARLGDYLADKFLTCNVGKRGMFYDAVGRAIVYADNEGNVTRARATLKHRLRIEVRAE